MEKQKRQKQIKNAKSWISTRISLSTKKEIDLLLKKANNKKHGRKIKPDELYQLGLTLISDEHIQRLQSNSLSHEDRKEELRQIYIKKHGPISKDDFTGFMMTPAFFEFLNEQNHQKN